MNVYDMIKISSDDSLFIFNGSVMKNEISRNIPEYKNDYVSMNEAISEGEVSFVIFSDEFIKCRIESLDTNKKIYNEKVMNEIYKLNTTLHNNIVLFFGSDMFCIINLITIIAYIRQLNLNSSVSIYIVDENDYQIISEIDSDIDYESIYKTVLVDKKIMTVNNELIDKNIRKYLEYHEDSNVITEFIEKNKEENDLLELLFAEFEDYGLTDQQYKRLIKKA